MEKEPITVAEEAKKPRKRFVGRAKKVATTEANLEGGAIEEGAVGFASKRTVIQLKSFCLTNPIIKNIRSSKST